MIAFMWAMAIFSMAAKVHSSSSPGRRSRSPAALADTFVIGRDSGSGTVIQNGGTFTFNPANNRVMLVCATGDTRHAVGI